MAPALLMSRPCSVRLRVAPFIQPDNCPAGRATPRRPCVDRRGLREALDNGEGLFGEVAQPLSRLSFLDHSSDLVGSLQIPAASCGVYALRPTCGHGALTGLQPPGPPAAQSELMYLSTIGPIADPPTTCAPRSSPRPVPRTRPLAPSTGDSRRHATTHGRLPGRLRPR